jgi:tRNA G18 (ribose-2'-O)-methylase SpoU
VYIHCFIDLLQTAYENIKFFSLKKFTRSKEIWDHLATPFSIGNKFVFLSCEDTIMRKLLNEELDRLEVHEFKKATKKPIVVVLDNVRSMNNIGSVFRTADAFLVEAIYLCGITATPPHKDIHKTALGATESVNWKYFENTEEAIDLLRSDGYRILGIEQTEGSIMLQEYIPENGVKYGIIFGHEVRGVQQSIIDLCDDTIEIPQFGTKHSLNISVCAGLVIWEIFQKLRHKKSG